MLSIKNLKIRYFIYISYHGKNYCGWQIQKNGISVQQILNEKLSIVLKEEIQVTGCGRTDTGVHARNYVAHFDTSAKIKSPDDFIIKMNKFLPQDIVIHKMIQVQDDLHARFDAKERTYRYYISTKKDPFRRETSWYYPTPLNLKLMNQAAAVLHEYTDFTSFSKLHTDVKTNNCKIKEAFWKQEGDMLIFEITADRFLRNMVRAIVGTLVEIGREKITLQDFRKIIESKDRGQAGKSVPAEGLFLEGVGYEL